MAAWASGFLSCKVVSCEKSGKCLPRNQIPPLAGGQQSSAIFSPQSMEFLGGNSSPLGTIASGIDGHSILQSTMSQNLLLPPG